MLIIKAASRFLGTLHCFHKLLKKWNMSFLLSLTKYFPIPWACHQILHFSCSYCFNSFFHFIIWYSLLLFLWPSVKSKLSLYKRSLQCFVHFSANIKLIQVLSLSSEASFSNILKLICCDPVISCSILLIKTSQLSWFIFIHCNPAFNNIQQFNKKERKKQTNLG